MDVRVKKEKEGKEQKGKEKVEACLYTTIKVARDEDLGEQIGKEIYFDLVDHDKVRTFHIQKQTPFTQFKEEVAKAFGIPVRFQRYWLWAKRQNHTYRPDRALTAQEEIQPVGELREVPNKWNNDELKLFLEVELCLDLRPLHPPGKTTREEILLFLKLYDPMKETIRYVGRLSVKGSGKPLEIKTKLKELAGFSPDEEIELFEEIKFEPSVMCEKIDSMLSFRECQLEDGDIICFQKSLQNQCSEQYRFPEVPSFLEYMHNRQPKEHKMRVPSTDFSAKKPQPVEESTADVAESPRFTWTVDNFSKLNVVKLYSEAFSVGGYEWRILMYPKGNNKNHLSIYLYVVDSAALPYGWSRYAKFSLAVLDQVHGKFTVVRFRSLEKPKEDEFSLELSKQNNYDEVDECLARHLYLDDPLRVRLTSHDCFSQQPIWYRGVDRLTEMLSHYNQVFLDFPRYTVLDIPLPELQGLKTLKVTFNHAAKDEVTIHTIRLPKQSTTRDLLYDLKTKVELSRPDAELRLLEIFYHKIYKIFPLNERIENINDKYWTLRAEEIPEEEKRLDPHRHLIHVYHFMKDATQNQAQIQNFGEPFLLVVHKGETLTEVKARIQKKLQVSDEEISKWKFSFVSLGRPEYLYDSDIVASRFQRRDVYGAWEQYLGLEHTDNAPK